MTKRRALGTLIAAVAVMAVVYASVARAGVAWDLTAEGSATLSEETRRVLGALDRRIEITAFFPREAPGRVEAATLLSRYRDENRHIAFRVLDPTLTPAEAQRFGIEGSGSAAVQDVKTPKKVEIAQYAIEIDITSAIARLLRDVQGTICFTSGHGERGSGDDGTSGTSGAAALLRNNGYKTRVLDLLTGAGAIDRCDAIVMASPSAEPRGLREKALDRYLGGGGKAWFFAEPGGDVDLKRVLKRWGIRFLSGIVLEGDPSSHLPDDPTAPIVRRYAGGSPVVRGLGPTFFPRAQGVDVVDVDDPGLTVTELAATSDLGYLDRDDLSEFDPKVDVEGPIALGVAADASEVERPGSKNAMIKRTRVLAFGDADFIANGFLQDGSNAKLWLQGIDWLTQPEDLVTAVPAFPKVRELDLTAARSRYMLFLMAGMIPGLFMIAGGLVWAVRRGR